jgi:hypothetical protein
MSLGVLGLAGDNRVQSNESKLPVLIMALIDMVVKKVRATNAPVSIVSAKP